MMADLSTKEEKLTKWLKRQQGIIVAFSGGVDSALVLFMARKVLGKAKSIGVISDSESLKQQFYF
jgi:uncharacterized protein